jgi:hypothetical protein
MPAILFVRAWAKVTNIINVRADRDGTSRMVTRAVRPSARRYDPSSEDQADLGSGVLGVWKWNVDILEPEIGIQEFIA